MTLRLTDRVNNIKPSPTMAVTDKARQLRAAGRDVIGLGAGEPDFDTPEHIKEAAIKAIRDGITNYTAADGTPELKEAIVGKFERENNLSYKPTQVMASVGAKHCLFNVLQAMIQAGDEVLIPQPVWVSYPDMVILCDGVPVPVTANAAAEFKVTPEALEAAITPKTRLLMLNSPCNPTGKIYTKAEMAALGEVLLRHPQIGIVTDDIYEHLIFSDEGFCNIVNACPELKDRTIVINGVSKAYAMTGWRIGYAAGPDNVIGAMRKIQSQSTSNPTSIAQVAATVALNGDQSCIPMMLAAYKERHDYVVQRLNNIPGVRCLDSDGTFYAFPDFSEIISNTDGVNNDTELATQILEGAEVALVPGQPFGGDGHIRLSFATDMGTLTTALDRLDKMFAK